MEGKPQKVYSSILVKAVGGYDQVVTYSDCIATYAVRINIEMSGL